MSRVFPDSLDTCGARVRSPPPAIWRLRAHLRRLLLRPQYHLRARLLDVFAILGLYRAQLQLRQQRHRRAERLPRSAMEFIGTATSGAGQRGALQTRSTTRCMRSSACSMKHRAPLYRGLRHPGPDPADSVSVTDPYTYCRLTVTTDRQTAAFSEVTWM